MDTKAVLDIFPNNIKQIIESLEIKELEEIRIKVDKPLLLQIGRHEIQQDYYPTKEDVKNILYKLSNFSLYAVSEELKQGFITVKGGHRVGICGNCVMERNKVKTIKDISSINVRVCREIIDCSNKVIPYIVENNNVYNSIIISPPKCGKTTILRDIARKLSDGMPSLEFRGKKISIIDERSEIGGCYNGIPQLQIGIRTDIFDNCPKSEGIMMAIRSMSPDIIICDEIGSKADVESILMALSSGVKLITTIHGFGIEDLTNREVFKDLIGNKVFKRGIVLSNSEGTGTIEYVYDFTKGEKIWRR
ncbi:MAG TPA: stage III sporulation protein AA [Clostridiaceae bacterium]